MLTHIAQRSRMQHSERLHVGRRSGGPRWPSHRHVDACNHPVMAVKHLRPTATTHQIRRLVQGCRSARSRTVCHQAAFTMSFRTSTPRVTRLQDGATAASMLQLTTSTVSAVLQMSRRRIATTSLMCRRCLSEMRSRDACAETKQFQTGRA